MTKQPFTHKPNAPKGPKPPRGRELHGEKVQAQKQLAKRNK